VLRGFGAWQAEDELPKGRRSRRSDVPRWIEFFLVHEAHHLYVVMTRLGEARALG
jgi:hypothetical protein